MINESFGVNTGNQILFDIGSYIKSKCLESGELVCRFYADNFVILMKKPEFFWQIEERVFRIYEVEDVLKKDFLERFHFSFSSSVFYIEDTKASIESMIEKANLAQKIKKNNFSTQRVYEYTAEMKNENDWNREITVSMESAFNHNEFEVFFQPKYRFSDECVIGAEALIRWNNPSKGFLTPGKFIPLFENNGFIEKIDKYVLQKVCSFLQNWSDYQHKNPNAKSIDISFNLSRYHLYNPNLIEEMKEIVEKFDVGSNKIEVELTESIMFENQKRLIKIMNEIKKLGFSISVDDFGSGYSSLNLLKDMPADVIKIDKDFLSNVPENNKENIIITSVISMAKKLNLVTVAEGVESKVQCDLLKDIGCDIAQGFYYAHPMTEEDFLILLKNNVG